MGHQTEILLTGLPRSGTTLATALLNASQNVVALNEPLTFDDFVGEPDEVASRVSAYMKESRAKLLETRQIYTTLIKGSGGTNSFGVEVDASGLRKSVASKGLYRIDKNLPENFVLVIKHPMAFSSILGVLKSYLPVYAIIRNPIAVLVSWNSINAPIGHGRDHHLERRDPVLRHILQGHVDVLSKQLSILNWLFERYHEELENKFIIRYEDVIASQGKSLELICPNAQLQSQALKAGNTFIRHTRATFTHMRDSLLDSPGSWRNFYSQDDLIRIADGYLGFLGASDDP